MNSLTKIACRALGVTGIGFACYDAVKVSKLMGRQEASFANQKYLEDAYFKSRTIDDISYNKRNAANLTFNLRSNNPLPSIGGSIKGGIKGFFYGLGVNLPLVTSSAIALVSKGFFAKAGAIGTVCCAIYNVLRQGYGIGKNNPMV